MKQWLMSAMLGVSGASTCGGAQASSFAENAKPYLSENFMKKAFSVLSAALLTGALCAAPAHAQALPPAPNLSVTNVAPTTVAEGQNLSYNVSVGNIGNADATNVTLSVPLTPGTTFVSATQTAGVASTLTSPAVGANGTVSASIGTLSFAANAAHTTNAATLSVNLLLLLAALCLLLPAITGQASFDLNQPRLRTLFTGRAHALAFGALLSLFAAATPAEAAPPTINSTITISNIRPTTIDASGMVTSTGGLNTERGIIYSQTSLNNNPVLNGSNVTKLNSGTSTATGDFGQVAGSLSHSTSYTFRGYATNNDGTVYSNTATATTLAETVKVAGTTVLATGNFGASGQTVPGTIANPTVMSGYVTRTEPADKVIFTLSTGKIVTAASIAVSNYSAGSNPGKVTVSSPTGGTQVTNYSANGTVAVAINAGSGEQFSITIEPGSTPDSFSATRPPTPGTRTMWLRSRSAICRRQ